MTVLAIIYAIGLIVSAMLAYTYSTDRHWAEKVGTVVMCLFWFIVAGTCIIAIFIGAWDKFAYRERGRATGDWRP